METFIDSHAHLGMSPLWEQVEEIIEQAREKKVSHIVNICTDLDTFNKGESLRKKYPFIINAAATSPHDVEKDGDNFFPIVATQAKKKNIFAIGECGLDYYYEHSSREIQKNFLRKYFKLALETSLPIIIHCREAFKDLFEIADKEYIKQKKMGPAVLHCFTGTSLEAQEVIKRGWFISFSGIITFKKSDALRDVVKETPLEKMLIETDSPYLAPQKYRGKVNQPSYVVEIAKMIAEIKKTPIKTVAQITASNAKQVFSIL
jgi:TatD DNase family protein